MSDDVKVRGYIVAKTASYLKQATSESEQRKIFEGLSPPVAHAIREAKPADWMPAAYSAELLRAVAGLAKGSDDAAKNELVKCGRYIAGEATNTFLRLLMKVLTPAMFAKRLPSLWQRDSTHGRYEVDVTSEKITCRMREMQVYEYIAPIGVGFVSHALEAMGKTITKQELHGWSLANPNPSDPWFELHWSK